jgi:hypothetical protein
MSAFVVGVEHIDALVHVALHGAKDGEAGVRGDNLTWQIDAAKDWSRENIRELIPYEGSSANYQPMTPDELGDMLVRENVRSVIGRYPDTLNGTPMPGPIDEYWRQPYQYPDAVKPMVPGMAAVVVAVHSNARTVRHLTSAEAFKCVHCLRYQSCEHDEWESSEAHSFLQALSEMLAHRLPGYNAAPWGL